MSYTVDVHRGENGVNVAGFALMTGARNAF
jgi:hypothetical protein